MIGMLAIGVGVVISFARAACRAILEELGITSGGSYSAAVGPLTIAAAQTGSWTANTTYETVYQREGEYIRAWTKLTFSDAPTPAVALTLDLPDGLTPDTGNLPASATFFTVGSAWLEGNGDSYPGPVILTGGVIAVYRYAPVARAITPSSPGALVNGNLLLVEYRVRVAEWVS